MFLNIVGALALVIAGTAAAQAESGAQSSLGNASLAVETLQTALKDGASAEAGAEAGLKAEELMTAQAAAGPRDAVDGQPGGSDTGGSGSRRIPNLTASFGKDARPAAPTRGPAVPEPGAPSGPGKPTGFIDRLRQGASHLIAPFTHSFGSLSRGQRIAFLAGLLVVEAAIIVYPYEAVGIAMRALAVLGLFGTTRELIARFRRGE